MLPVGGAYDSSLTHLKNRIPIDIFPGDVTYFRDEMVGDYYQQELYDRARRNTDSIFDNLPMPSRRSGSTSHNPGVRNKNPQNCPPSNAGSQERVSGRNPPINQPRQDLHTNGTAGKSRFKNGLDTDGLVKDAWENGTPKFNKNGDLIGKVKEYRKAIGVDGQKSVDTRFSREKGIHGFPSNKSE